MPIHVTDGIPPEDADNVRDLMPPSPVQECRKCHRMLPLNEQHFNRDRRRRTGHKPVCIDCMAKKRISEDNKQIKALSQKMDLAILKMFHDTLSDFKGGVPHIARFAEEILAESGGLKGFVQQIMADRLMAPAGGAIRLKYDTMLYQFMLKATEHGAVKTPVELMGKEECQAELDEILAQEVERKLHLRLADGTQQVPKDPEPPQAMAQ